MAVFWNAKHLVKNCDGFCVDATSSVLVNTGTAVGRNNDSGRYIPTRSVSRRVVNSRRGPGALCELGTHLPFGMVELDPIGDLVSS